MLLAIATALAMQPQAASDEGSRHAVVIEAVALQAPTLRAPIVRLDRRFVGPTSTLGGAGLAWAWRFHPSLELLTTVHSASIRYDTTRSGEVNQTGAVSQDLAVALGGLLLELVSGPRSRLALEASAGAAYNRVTVDLSDGRRGAQHYASLLLRAGALAEIRFSRISLWLAIRGYGVALDPDRVKNTGILSLESPRATAAARQTYLAGSAGLGYRF